jgi:putative FmdB family regulatory protein
MPIYEYECRNCGTQFEQLEKLSSKKTTVCKRAPKCQGRAERIPSTSNAHFKGQGFHANDYAGIK